MRPSGTSGVPVDIDYTSAEMVRRLAERFLASDGGGEKAFEPSSQSLPVGLPLGPAWHEDRTSVEYLEELEHWPVIVLE
jgi:hypothetical protein